MSERIVVWEITALEAAHLSELLDQFDHLLAAASTDDPAIARLVPDAYRDDPEAAHEFRSLTEGDLLARRREDCHIVASTLEIDGRRLVVSDLDRAEIEQTHTVAMDETQSAAWLRTLASLRLVMAARLGIRDEDDHADDDPRFGIYDWLGYRLDGLVRALDD